MSRSTKKKILGALLFIGVGLVVGGAFLPLAVGAAVISVGGVVLTGAIYVVKSLLEHHTDSPSTSSIDVPRRTGSTKLTIRIPTDEERRVIFEKVKRDVPPTPRGYKTPPSSNPASPICPPAPTHKEMRLNPDRPRGF